jgi:Glyoxalase-like domain
MIAPVPHRSRLGIVLLDLPPERHAAGTAFWSAATGRPAAPDPADPDWTSLGSFAGGFHVEVQRTGAGTPPRWHVDVETDDIEAEVARLEALGATRHRDMGRFWQMLDPAGLVFCVVGVQTGAEFERYATTWP